MNEGGEVLTGENNAPKENPRGPWHLFSNDEIEDWKSAAEQTGGEFSVVKKEGEKWEQENKDTITDLIVSVQKGIVPESKSYVKIDFPRTHNSEYSKKMWEVTQKVTKLQLEKEKAQEQPSQPITKP
ncbi:hypothetical protein KJ980_05865 [Patescibacteria group bacterium]|nr:hypothetical protein [Patescibacteria group bacterium]MBU4015966.1 hypothetical protein [Patescibacteria group bacterium]MBU4099146.1 hypothetical protein [Patescibacteria group bacterium]